MAKIVWTKQALEDLEDIATFIEKDSPHYAQLLVTKVFESVEILVDFTDYGRIVPETNNPKIREIILGNYRVIYKIMSEQIQVLAVYHSSRIIKTERLPE